jgi:hypothetical protein
MECVQEGTQNEGGLATRQLMLVETTLDEDEGYSTILNFEINLIQLKTQSSVFMLAHLVL